MTGRKLYARRLVALRAYKREWSVILPADERAGVDRAIQRHEVALGLRAVA